MLKASAIPNFWKPYLFEHLGPAFQCKLLQDAELDSNSEEVNEEAEDQDQSDHALMWCLEYLIGLQPNKTRAELDSSTNILRVSPVK